MDDKTTIDPSTPEADAHAGEPEEGPPPTAAELAERADGKAVEAAEGKASQDAADKAGKLYAAKMRFEGELMAIQLGETDPPDPMTDEDRAALAEAGIDVEATIAEERARHARLLEREAELQSDADESRDASPKAVFDDATIDRLRAQMRADRERAEAGAPLHARVQAAVDGPHARHAVSAMSLDGLGDAGEAELRRIAGAMGWAVAVEREHGLVVLRK